MSGNPDFLNTLKNTLNNYCPSVPKSARQEVYDRVRRDIPDIMKAEGLEEAVIAVVPRSKAFMSPNQLGFRDAVQECVKYYRPTDTPVSQMALDVLRGIQIRRQHIFINFYQAFDNCGSEPM